MSEIKPQPGVMDIALYVGGKSHVDGVENIVKLSSNENPLGPSEAEGCARAGVLEPASLSVDGSRSTAGGDWRGLGVGSRADHLWQRVG